MSAAKSFLTLSLTLSAATALAGTTMESVEHKLDGQRADTVTTISAQDGKLRVDSPASNGVMIFKDDTIYSLNTKDKTYGALDRATLQKMAEQISPALKQMQEQLAKMPPEQRAQVEKMMGKSMPGMGEQKTQEFRKTSRTDKIGGYSCTYVEMLEDGVLQNELCVVPSGQLKGSADLMAAAQKMRAMLDEMLKTLDSPWMKQMVERQNMNYSELGGVPVFTRRYEDGKPVAETTLRSIRTDSLPAATFEIPAGYAKQEMRGSRKGHS
jgi:hypothetical protein